LFNALKDAESTFNSEIFDRELNHILVKASTLFEKHLRTHSFRATLITDLLESVSIDNLKELISHRSTSLTLEYRRSRLSFSERKEILKTRDTFLDKKPKKLETI
jgi:integrase